MKKLFFIWLLTILIIPIKADEKFSFQIKPLPTLFFGILGVSWADGSETLRFVDIEFQYVINNKFTLFINPSFIYAYISEFMWEIRDENLVFSRNNLNLFTGLLYRPFGTGLRGMYLGVFPILGWDYITRNRKKVEDFFNLGCMAEVGYEWIFRNRFTITLGGGISKIYHLPKVSKIPEIQEYDQLAYGDNFYGMLWVKNSPVDMRLRFSIGYSF